MLSQDIARSLLAVTLKCTFYDTLHNSAGWYH